ncbi:MAG: NAD(P)-dependent oxidoreductase [Bacteriovoracaceae bacterium]|nr:NAD(P)-dependent oxidoreductase [Bacteriovoracaceae bacterium]
MKILVTGATGFVGSHLAEHLCEKGNDVYSLARNSKKFIEHGIKGKLISGAITSKCYNKWIDELPDDLDCVIHMAGLTHSQNIKNFYKVNTKNTKRLIDDLSAKYPKLRFVLISSLAAAGPSKKDCPIDESHPARPVSHYGQSKYQAEVALEEHAPKGWEKIIIRPPMVIGPKDPAFLEIFKMIKGGYMLYPGACGGNKEYTFVSVYDLCRVINKSLKLKMTPVKTELFLPGYPAPIKYNEIITTITKLLKKEQIKSFYVPLPAIYLLAKVLQLIHLIFPKFDPQLTPDKIAEIRPDAWTCDSSKSQNKLNLSYKWDLENILEKTHTDYIERKWL